MAPATILNKLAEVRKHERLMRFVWGTARAIAVALVLLLLCCFVDWLIDRWYDTPRALLALFLVTQVVVACGLAILFVLLPSFQRLSDSTVALWVERAFPAFRHRLVTAVELNRPHAATAGMSPVLIAAVTKEAEQRAAATDFRRAVDSRRLWWSLCVLAPVLLVVLVLLVVAPVTMAQLVGRQLLLPIDITRSVRFELQDVTTLPAENAIDRDEPRLPHTSIEEAAVCASGDRVAIRFKAEGRVSEKTRGTLRIRPNGGAAEDVPLEWESAASNEQGATFVAKIPASSVEFTYKAWLGDARLRQEGHVQFETRPTVESQKVTVLLPEYCGFRADGTRFEQKTESDTKGEVVGLSGSTAVVTVAASKPLKKATLELLGPTQAGAPEQVLASKEMTLDGNKATGRFDLDPSQTAYRIVLWDTFGFANRVIPRRGVAQLPDEPPLVALLPERFTLESARLSSMGITEDNEVEGLPVLQNGSIRIAYRVKSAVGLDEARLWYRVNEGKWAFLALREYKGSAETGPFELERGVFKNISEEDDKAQVEFHALEEPEATRDLYPNRREGGGRFDFQTATIPGLKVGDKIEFYIEVDDVRNPNRLKGTSEHRLKEVVNLKSLLAWFQAKRQEVDKLIDLKNRQSGLFDPVEPQK